MGNNIQMVSVIIPNYNHENYLDERIQSVLNQTYRDFEIIILDDCSTDNSRAVIEKYHNNQYVSHIEYNEQNSGTTFKQWEKGIELAKGELIWIAESDDSCDKSFLETMVRKFDDERVVLAFSRSMQIDQDGRKLGIYPNQTKMNTDISISGLNFLRSNLSKYNVVVNASSALIRKDIIKNISKDYYSYRGCGDWLFWIYVAELGYVSYVPKPLNLFRQHITNTTSMLHKSGNNAKEVHRIYKYLSHHHYLIGLNKIRFRISRLASYLSVDQFSGRTVQKEVLEEWQFSFVDYILAWMLRVYRQVLCY